MKIIYTLIVLLFSLLFIGCSSKLAVDTMASNEIQLNKNKKRVYVEVINKTDENIFILYDIKEGLNHLDYEILDNQDKSDYKLTVTIVFASEIDRTSTTKNILRDININVGVGGGSGNFGVYTKVGATLGKILGDRLDSTNYQVVVDITIDEAKEENSTKTQNKQLILTAPLNGHEKEKVIYSIEEEISKRVLEIF